VEVLLEQQPVGLDVDGQQDKEAPHGEEVGEARDRPLQQPSLTEHLGHLGPDPPPDIVGAAGGGLAGHGELGQPANPTQREQSDDRRHAEAHYQSDQHLRLHSSVSPIPVTER
jgi:hypothetical protein